MKVVKVKKTSPPPKKTPRRFTVELSEGEVDLILGLLARTFRLGSNVRIGHSPQRYANRLINDFAGMLGQAPWDTDTYQASKGEIYTTEYGNGEPWSAPLL